MNNFEQIRNLYRLFKYCANEEDEFGFSESQKLTPQELGFYLFKNLQDQLYRKYHYLVDFDIEDAHLVDWFSEYGTSFTQSEVALDDILTAWGRDWRIDRERDLRFLVREINMLKRIDSKIEIFERSDESKEIPYEWFKVFKEFRDGVKELFELLIVIYKRVLNV